MAKSQNNLWTWDLWIEEIGVGNQDVLETHEQKQVVPAGMNAFMILLSLLVKPCGPIFLKACGRTHPIGASCFQGALEHFFGSNSSGSSPANQRM